MQFSSFSEFLAMGGYGFYVWLSYGVSLGLLVLLAVMSKQRHQKVVKQLQARDKREQKLKQAAQRHAEQQHAFANGNEEV
jgi:heme exporter protein D